MGAFLTYFVFAFRENELIRDQVERVEFLLPRQLCR